MRTGTRVEDQNGTRGTVTDTCDGGAWVTFTDGRTDFFEEVEPGEFFNVDTDDTVRPA